MKTSSHFSSRTSALVLWSVLTASTLFAGVTLAQSLNIPTNLDNAVITIQRIFLSNSGVSTLLSTDNVIAPNESTIAIDGANGSITTRWDNANLTIWGKLQFTHSDYSCTPGATGCLLKVDGSGMVFLSNDLSGSDENIFRRTPGSSTNQKNNIYLALEDGEATVAGQPSSTQSFLRVGAGDKNDTTEPIKPDTAIVAAWVIESRGGLYIKKVNNDAELSNSIANRTAKVTEDYTALDLNTTEGKINFTSSNDVANSSQDTSFLFSADGAMTKVGINIPSGESPTNNLEVSQNGTLMVGNAQGFCCNMTSWTCEWPARACSTNSQCTNAGFPTCMLDPHPDVAFFVDGVANQAGINTSKPIVEMHVGGSFIATASAGMEGQCVRTDASNAWLLSYASRCTNTQTCQDLYGGSAVCTLDTYVVGAHTVTTDGSVLTANSNSRKVGVNTFSPSKDFDVRGTASVSTSLIVGHAPNYDPGTDKIAVNGSTRANAYYYNSDRRYKSDIEVLKSPLENLLKLSGYRYFNKLSNKQDLWVIAQEVETVYPELVQTDADGYKSVEYGNLVAPIIEAIKELATKIDSLFTLYVSQQAKIDTLEARLLKLESQVK